MQTNVLWGNKLHGSIETAIISIHFCVTLSVSIQETRYTVFLPNSFITTLYVKINSCDIALRRRNIRLVYAAPIMKINLSGIDLIHCNMKSRNITVAYSKHVTKEAMQFRLNCYLLSAVEKASCDMTFMGCLKNHFRKPPTNIIVISVCY
jgi:hypothetical protein